MRRAWLIGLVLLAGCTNERALELSITASEDVPDEVVAWELRVVNVEDGAPCPTASESASAARVGRLGQAQTFTDVGMAVGEIPRGRWAFAVLGRDVDCGLRFYGCTAVNIGGETFSPIAIRVEPVSDVTALCGSCRSCSSGACSPEGLLCD